LQLFQRYPILKFVSHERQSPIALLTRRGRTRRQDWERISMRMTRWCLISVLGASLLGAGCNIAGTSTQEDLGRGIVRGTLGAQPAGDVRLARPTNTDSFTGLVAAVEGGAYVVQEVSGHER